MSSNIRSVITSIGTMESSNKTISGVAVFIGTVTVLAIEDAAYVTGAGVNGTA